MSTIDNLYREKFKGHVVWSHNTYQFRYSQPRAKITHIFFAGITPSKYVFKDGYRCTSCGLIFEFFTDCVTHIEKSKRYHSRYTPIEEVHFND